MKSKTSILIVSALGLCLLAGGQERFDIKVRKYFFGGFQGDAAALEQGMKITEDALAANPQNAEALVWHGSGLSFRAGQAFARGDTQKGTDLWQRGMSEMDRAVALAPDDVGVRIPRGASLLGSSHFIPDSAIARPLIEKGVGDYEKTYQLQKDRFDKLGLHPRGELMIGLADGYSRLGDHEKARLWFERIRTELKGTLYADSANEWMKTGSLSPRQAGCLGCHTGD